MADILYFAGNMISGAVIAAILWLALYPLRRRRLTRLGLHSGAAREILLLLFVAFCGAMAAATLTPPDFDLWIVLHYGYPERFFRPGDVNWQVFREIRRALAYSPIFFWGNVILFAPFGFLPAVLWRGSRWYKALAIAVCVTAAIESWQYFIGRTFDVDDLLLNAAGALLGWLLWLLLKKPTLTCEER